MRRKVDLHVSYWNVQTLQDVSLQALTIQELRKFNVTISCFSEVRAPGDGHSVIKVRKSATASTTMEQRIIPEDKALQSLSARPPKLKRLTSKETFSSVPTLNVK